MPVKSPLIEPERSSRELILFAIIAFGLLLSVAGLVVSSIPMWILGLVFGGTGLGGFWVRQWLGE
jgi:nitrate reductase NapE component